MVNKNSVVAILLIGIMIQLYGMSPFSVSGGIGKYELVHLGANWHFGSCRLSALAGTNFGLGESVQYSTGLIFDQTLFYSKEWMVKPGYSLGAIYWTQDDEWYYFQSLSIPVMLNASYKWNPSFSIRAGGGVVFTSVFTSDRKQNVTSGYPRYMNFNFSTSVTYQFKRRKEKSSGEK